MGKNKKMGFDFDSELEEAAEKVRLLSESAVFGCFRLLALAVSEEVGHGGRQEDEGQEGQQEEWGQKAQAVRLRGK